MLINNNHDINYMNKYLKYKQKYLNLKNDLYGGAVVEPKIDPDLSASDSVIVTDDSDNSNKKLKNK